MKKVKHITPEKLFGVEEFYHYIKINGKYYVPTDTGRDGKPTFIEVSKKDVDEHLKMSKELAENLKNSLDADKVLIEVFMQRYSKKELEKIHKYVLKGKKKLKPKTREGYCVDLKVGNHIIPIID